MSEVPSPDGVPTAADLVEELAGQERSERRLLVRQLLILLTLVTLLLAHVLLG
jgi:hypothetical protein